VLGDVDLVWFSARGQPVERREVALFVPDLYDAEAVRMLPSDIVRVRYAELERWRARSISNPLTDGRRDAVLCNLFGITVPADQDTPSASLSRLYDLSESELSDPARYWLRADPVHLRADQGRVLMIGADALRLDEEAGAELLAEINSHVAADGLHLYGPAAKRWYLSAGETPRIRTTPWRTIVGEDIAPYLPSGPDAARWRALMNEIQMVLYASEVNRRRLEQGELPVNSVWFWGGGRLPDRGRHEWDAVWSDDTLALGLAAYHGVHSLPMPSGAESWRASVTGARHLIMVDGGAAGVPFGEADARLAYVEEVERRWLTPLAKQLRDGELTSVDLYPGDGHCYHATGALLKRWWRRRPP